VLVPTRGKVNLGATTIEGLRTVVLSCSSSQRGQQRLLFLTNSFLFATPFPVAADIGDHRRNWSFAGRWDCYLQRWEEPLKQPV